jgi:FkbM family methyltransferase
MNSKLIYDVGMHRGEDTDFYLKKGFGVVGFEADPRMIDICKDRFRSAIASGQLRIVEGVIAPRGSCEQVEFFRNTGNSVWGTANSDWARRNANFGFASENILLKRIDITNAYRTFGIPYYLKVDIEGSDKLVLEGLMEFDSRPNYVSIESEKVDFTALQAEISLLQKLGYTQFKAVQQESIAGSRVVTDTLDGGKFEHVFEQEASGPFGDEIQQPWLGSEDLLRQYKAIFYRYRLFGHDSMCAKAPRFLARPVELIYRAGTGYRGPLPGWFDTHATL